jgi:hypothetical protein
MATLFSVDGVLASGIQQVSEARQGNVLRKVGLMGVGQSE